MRIAIEVDRADAIKAGKDRYGWGVAEVPAAEFGEAERNFLADLPVGKDHKADGVVWPSNYSGSPYAGGFRPSVPTTDFEPATVRRLVAELTVWQATKAERAAKEKAASDAKAVARVEALRGEPAESLIYHNGSAWALLNKATPNYGDPDAAKAILAEMVAPAMAECERRNAEAKAKADAAKAAKEAEAKVNRGRLATWTRRHGGELARLRLEDGYDCWVTAAKADYVAAVLVKLRALLATTEADEPDGTDGHPRTEARKCPTAVEILALRAATKAAEEIDPDGQVLSADLVRVQYDRDDDADEDDTPAKQYRVEIAVSIDVFGLGTESRRLLIPGCDLFE